MKKERYKIAVLGAGSWGITLGNVLHENGNDVTLWEFDPEQGRRLNRNRSFVTLGDYRIPEDIKIVSSLDSALKDADYIVISVPSTAVSAVAYAISEVSLKSSVVFISTVKGFDSDTLMRPSEILRSRLGKRYHIIVLSGPSHAEEVVSHIPTAVVAASVSRDARKAVQKLFSNIYFRVYTSEDIHGVELGGALKNVIAIASGISSGLGLGDNTKAALITRSTLEITRLGMEMGAKRNTFSGLSGIGDLIVTCFSEHSRNFRFGRLIGEGLSFDEALEKMESTVEGVNTTKCCYRLARKYYIQMPVCDKVYQILFKGNTAARAWKELMSRPLRSEELDY